MPEHWCGWGKLHLWLYHPGSSDCVSVRLLTDQWQDLGWNWTYGICACLYGLFIILIFFFVPETFYKRDPAYNLDLGTTDHTFETIDASEVKAEHPEHLEMTKSGAKVHAEVLYTGADEPPYTFWENLRPVRGVESDENLLYIIFRPFGMLLFPQVLYAFITYGLSTSWLVVMISVLAQLFTGPPYNFSVSGVGLISIAPLVASLLGFMAGPLNDMVVKKLARLNKGVYEPEFRLLLNIFTLILGVVGFSGFGATLQNEAPWAGPVVLYG